MPAQLSHLSQQQPLKTSSTIANKILRACLEREHTISPRSFCRRWFGLESVDRNSRPRFTEQQILILESEHGYREKCINLIATLLKIEPNTVHRWGKGVEFDKIPVNQQRKYEVYLGYVDSLRIITTTLSEVDNGSLLKLLQELSY